MNTTVEPGRDESPIFRLRPRVDWREVDGEIVALHAGRSAYLAVNAPGSVLWGRLAGGATVEELVDEVVRRFAVERPRAAADVGAFLDDLRRLDLLESPA